MANKYVDNIIIENARIFLEISEERRQNTIEQVIETFA